MSITLQAELELKEASTAIGTPGPGSSEPRYSMGRRLDGSSKVSRVKERVMEELRDRHWTELVTNLQFGRCVLVLGPEIEVEPPAGEAQAGSACTWADRLAEHLTNALLEEKKNVPQRALMAVAQQYEDERGFGPDSLQSQTARFARTCGLKPSATHRLLAKLPFNLVLSTSHDELITQAMWDEHKHPDVAFYHLRGDRRDNPELPALGSPSSPQIYHLFGSTRDPYSLVLSENDLLDFLIAVVSKNPPLPNNLVKVLEHALSFLFVGFGIRYSYLRVLLKFLVRALNLPSASIRFVMEPLESLPRADREEMILFYQRGTQILFCDDPPIPRFFELLGEKLAAEGGYRGPTPSRGTRPKVFISYTRADEPLAAKLYSTLKSKSFDPWFDKQSLEGGDPWDQEIESGLSDTDFVLVIYSRALIHQWDGYVNKEIGLARERAKYVRGKFLVPLRTVELTNEERIKELQGYHEMVLREEQYEQDVGQLVSLMTREFQRRSQ
ncbi:toll/interleukin-1 receptor domain-containing protein [Archangium lansingense]|uniref:Toll/interleukin-1 receptor domain-containing protein n=1 Tax=Archangium lansingense TaxID=2995310 RepID=A0ABT3ZY26_9BACT|nr:toll/interleukin-1 receptor domain-containing protein [Archangium lansinium]MCY1074313.1 toll/interleukin-1 receptor domain-containing protein [Archangium lansinium]